MGNDCDGFVVTNLVRMYSVGGCMAIVKKSSMSNSILIFPIVGKVREVFDGMV